MELLMCDPQNPYKLRNWELPVRSHAPLCLVWYWKQIGQPFIFWAFGKDKTCYQKLLWQHAIPSNIFMNGYVFVQFVYKCTLTRINLNLDQRTESLLRQTAVPTIFPHCKVSKVWRSRPYTDCTCPSWHA